METGREVEAVGGWGGERSKAIEGKVGGQMKVKGSSKE